MDMAVKRAMLLKVNTVSAVCVCSNIEDHTVVRNRILWKCVKAPIFVPQALICPSSEPVVHEYFFRFVVEDFYVHMQDIEHETVLVSTSRTGVVAREGLRT